MKYKVLINREEGYGLERRSGNTIKALRLLQVRSAYYSDHDRYGIIKEQCIDGWIKKEVEKDNGMISFELVPPEIGADQFRDEVAKLLFPSAPVSENIGDIDYEVVEEGLEDFLNFIEPRHRRQLDIQSLLKASQAAQTVSTNPETHKEGPSKKTPTAGTSGT